MTTNERIQELEAEVEVLRQERDAERGEVMRLQLRRGGEQAKDEVEKWQDIARKRDEDTRLTVVGEALERWRNRVWGPQSAIRSGPAELQRCIEDMDAALQVDPSPKQPKKE